MIDTTKVNKKRGFTLIETMVAITIFLITIFLVTQVYVETIRMERVAYGLLNRDNSVRYALELMARDIRMAKADTIPAAGSSSTLNFKVYYSGTSYTTVIYKLTPDGKIERTEGVKAGSITNSSVTISDLKFTINNTYLQPRVIISFKAKVGSSNPIFVQTSVTPRYPYIREI